jgi:hypothetical protein
MTKSSFTAAVVGLLLASGAQAEPSETIEVTAERLSRSVLKRESTQFILDTLPDTVSGQHARWESPICVTAFGIPESRAKLFSGRVIEVARHVGVRVDEKPDCEPNVTIVFTGDARALMADLAKRRPLAFDPLPGRERKLMLKSDLPVRWWHYTDVNGSDGRQMSNLPAGGAGILANQPYRVLNNTRATRLESNVQAVITGAVIVVDVPRVEAVPLLPLTDYVAMVALSRVRLGAVERPEGSIMRLIGENGAGKPAPEGITALDEALLVSLYKTKGNLEASSQRARMAAVMADRITDDPEVQAAGANLPKP